MKAWIGGIVFVLVVGVLMLAAHGASSPDAQQKAAEREAIAQCVKARDDELSDLSTRRFMRQACEQMDKEFQAKWGIGSREL
jgi:hypothetical protein